MKTNRFSSALVSLVLLSTGSIGMNIAAMFSPVVPQAQAQAAGQSVSTLRGCFINSPFTGTIHFNPTNIREQPTRNARAVGKFTNVGEAVRFSGINVGEAVPDSWDGKPDDMWYRLDGRGWVASAVVKGYPNRVACPISSTWQNPLPGYRVTSEMGWRPNPTRPGSSDFHSGIDLGTQGGTPPVKAAKDGQVVFAGWNDQGYGNLVIIQHSDGVKTYYAHLSRITVGLNTTVRGGSQIGLVGSTGNSTGNHLHFEVRVSPYNWQSNNRNPRDYVKF